MVLMALWFVINCDYICKLQCEAMQWFQKYLLTNKNVLSFKFYEPFFVTWKPNDPLCKKSLNRL